MTLKNFQAQFEKLIISGYIESGHIEDVTGATVGQSYLVWTLEEERGYRYKVLEVLEVNETGHITSYRYLTNFVGQLVFVIVIGEGGTVFSLGLVTAVTDDGITITDAYPGRIGPGGEE